LETLIERNEVEKMGALFFVVFIGYGILQIVAGFVGIEYGLGPWWAWGALIAAFMFRFTLPITVGAFFGAMNVWDWHWFFALLFAAPGLALVIPGVLAELLSSRKR